MMHPGEVNSPVLYLAIRKDRIHGEHVLYKSKVGSVVGKIAKGNDQVQETQAKGQYANAQPRRG